MVRKSFLFSILFLLVFAHSSFAQQNLGIARFKPEASYNAGVSLLNLYTDGGQLGLRGYFFYTEGESQYSDYRFVTVRNNGRINSNETVIGSHRDYHVDDETIIVLDYSHTRRGITRKYIGEDSTGPTELIYELPEDTANTNVNYGSTHITMGNSTIGILITYFTTPVGGNISSASARGYARFFEVDFDGDIVGAIRTVNLTSGGKQSYLLGMQPMQTLNGGWIVGGLEYVGKNLNNPFGIFVTRRVHSAETAGYERTINMAKRFRTARIDRFFDPTFRIARVNGQIVVAAPFSRQAGDSKNQRTFFARLRENGSLNGPVFQNDLGDIDHTSLERGTFKLQITPGIGFSEIIAAEDDCFYIGKVTASSLENAANVEKYYQEFTIYKVDIAGRTIEELGSSKLQRIPDINTVQFVSMALVGKRLFLATGFTNFATNYRFIYFVRVRTDL